MLLYTIDLCVRFKSFIIESTTKLEYNVIIIITVPFELYRNVKTCSIKMNTMFGIFCQIKTT